MQQVSLRLIIEENLQYAVKDLLVYHELDLFSVLRLDDGLKEFDDFHIGLNRIILMALNNLNQDLIVVEKHAQLV